MTELTELAKTPGYIYGIGYGMGMILYTYFRKKGFQKLYR